VHERLRETIRLFILLLLETVENDFQIPKATIGHSKPTVYQYSPVGYFIQPVESACQDFVRQV
jgi:hypothetical protein